MEIQLGDLFLNKGGSVNPAKHPEETFEYYSIPAYDTGEPEIILGSGIGSSKKVFKPNDIILSRIVPHIRRCWVVGPDSGYRQIGSGEWITFRSEKIEPSFLKHYLMSNEFNAKFLKTIKGVGGSLMRADPKQVARFNLILPPLDQQKKIAAILDTAYAYRQKTKALIEKYDELTESLFISMFGDPVTNPKGWDKRPMGELMTIVRGGSPRPIDKFLGGNYPWIKIGDATKGDDIYLNSTKQSIIEAGLSKTRLLPKGSLIFANCGVSLGFARIINIDGCIHDGWLAFSDFDTS